MGSTQDYPIELNLQEGDCGQPSEHFEENLTEFHESTEVSQPLFISLNPKQNICHDMYTLTSA